MMTKITQIVRTSMGKALIVLWVLALLSLISFPILGIFQHELLGNLALEGLRGRCPIFPLDNGIKYVVKR